VQPDFLIVLVEKKSSKDKFLSLIGEVPCLLSRCSISAKTKGSGAPVQTSFGAHHGID
jgi:hypothetical protein